MPQDQIYNWMIADLQGVLKPDEKQEFERLLAENSDAAEQYKELRREYLIYYLSDKSEALQKNLFLQSRLSLLQGWKLPVQEPIDMPLPSPLWKQLSGIAASVVLVLAAFIGAWYFFQNNNKPLPTAEVPVVMKELINKSGYRSMINFIDGTKVTLGVNSRLRYPDKFSGATREVYLEGEAFFEVAHDSIHAFIVHTSEVDTRVLGTSFNIKAYSAQAKTEVTVASGKVEVSSSDSQMPFAPTKLSPGQQLVCTRESGRWDVTQVNPDAVSAWRTGTIVFDHASFTEMISTLKNWYDVDILINDKALKKCTFHATFQLQPLSELLRKLQFSAQFKYTIKGRQITISGGNCP
jgi:transmembrane sensor